MLIIKCDKCGDVVPRSDAAMAIARWSGSAGDCSFDLCLRCVRVVFRSLIDGMDPKEKPFWIAAIEERTGTTGLLEGTDPATAMEIALRNVSRLARGMMADADATVRECGLSMIIFCQEAGIEAGGNV